MGYKVEKFTREISVKDYIAGGFVRPDEFIEYCKQCSDYGRVWSCPPYDFKPLDYWKQFDSLVCYALKFEYDEGTDKEKRRAIMFDLKNQMLEELLSMEKEFPGSKALSAGNCMECWNCIDQNSREEVTYCSRIKGEPCRKCDRMRYSIESIGGDTMKTMKELFGVEILWAHGDELVPYNVLLGGLLKK